MNVKVIDTKELPDGGLEMQVEADLEFTQAAVNFYLTYILERALDDKDKEYAIKTEKGDDVAKS